MQFTDKLENIIETMDNTAAAVKGAEPISAHPDKLKDQLAENEAIMEDLDKKLAALQTVKATAEEIMAQAGGLENEEARGKELAL